MPIWVMILFCALSAWFAYLVVVGRQLDKLARSGGGSDNGSAFGEALGALVVSPSVETYMQGFEMMVTRTPRTSRGAGFADAGLAVG